MIYLSGAPRLTLKHPMLGFMYTPRMGQAPPADIIWAADNGRFAAPQNYTDDGFLAWLERHSRLNCLFATAPDIVGDHAATVTLSLPMLPRIRALGYPVAFVAQDGWDEATTPWHDFDVLFLGGTTKFKLGRGGIAAMAAKRRGKWVHMGRVNSYKRLRLAAAIGCDSADGTMIKYGPDRRGPEVIGWLQKLSQNPVMAL